MFHAGGWHTCSDDMATAYNIHIMTSREKNRTIFFFQSMKEALGNYYMAIATSQTPCSENTLFQIHNLGWEGLGLKCLRPKCFKFWIFLDFEISALYT